MCRKKLILLSVSLSLMISGCYPVEGDIPPEIEAQIEQAVEEDIASGRYDEETSS